MTSYFIITFDHKQSYWPPTVYRRFCELNDGAAFGNNQLWWPPASKVCLGYQKNYYVISEQSLVRYQYRFSSGLCYVYPLLYRTHCLFVDTQISHTWNMICQSNIILCFSMFILGLISLPFNKEPNPYYICAAIENK